MENYARPHCKILIRAQTYCEQRKNASSGNEWLTCQNFEVPYVTLAKQHTFLNNWKPWDSVSKSSKFNWNIGSFHLIHFNVDTFFVFWNNLRYWRDWNVYNRRTLVALFPMNIVVRLLTYKSQVINVQYSRLWFLVLFLFNKNNTTFRPA